jgi:hypothetical protein
MSDLSSARETSDALLRKVGVANKAPSDFGMTATVKALTRLGTLGSGISQNHASD